MGKDLLPSDIKAAYQIEERHHACSILKTDFPDQWKDLVEVLRSFKLRKSDMEKPGGNKSPIAKGLNGLFLKRGWIEKSFEIKVMADGAETLAPTHHVDYYKDRVAVETEGNPRLRITGRVISHHKPRTANPGGPRQTQTATRSLTPAVLRFFAILKTLSLPPLENPHFAEKCGETPHFGRFFAGPRS